MLYEQNIEKIGGNLLIWKLFFTLDHLPDHHVPNCSQLSTKMAKILAAMYP